MIERRNYVRYATDIWITFNIGYNEQKFRGKIINLSISGARIVTRAKLIKNSILFVNLTLPKYVPLEKIKSLVIYVQPQDKKSAAGVMFLDLNLEKVKMIRDYLVSLPEMASLTLGSAEKLIRP